MDVIALKNKINLTRDDISELLKSIGGPGKKRQAKLKAVRELERKNSQGFGIEETLTTYREF